MNMTMHDYAGCERAPCVRCHDYGLGWAHGKLKMADELPAVASGGHDVACGCQPCRVIRELTRPRSWRRLLPWGPR